MLGRWRITRRASTPHSAPIFDCPPRAAEAAGARGGRRALVLSDKGDHPMTKLSDTQAVILSAAAQRDDGAVLPLPETLRIKGGAVDKVLGSLKSKGLIDHQGAPRGDDPPPLRITRAGLEAIGVEPEDTGSDTALAEADASATAADAGVQAVDAPMPAAEADGAAKPAKKVKPAERTVKAAKPGKAARPEKPTPRAGTKQALLI